MTIEHHTHHRRTSRTGRKAAAGVAVAALVALAAPAVGSAKTHEAQRPLGPQLQRILDRGVHAPGAAAGVTLYVRAPGRGSWSGAAGSARIGPARPMRADNRFRAGSIMKPFIATATLQLVEEGKLSLDDTLPAVLPPSVTARFPEAGQITVRMLLNHTSGITDYTDDAFDREVIADPLRRWTTSEFLDRAAARPRSGAPGERWSYSNANYNLLGLILERKTGKPWRAVIRERIFEPLHLRHTSLPRPGTLPKGRDIAHGYQVTDGTLYDLTNVDSSMAGAAGGHALLTTAGDLSRFLRAVLTGKLFEKRETVKEMRTFVPASSEDGVTGYGLGLERYGLPGGIEVDGHVGTTGGYRMLMFHLPAQDVDIAMALNAPADPLPVLLPALKVLLAS